MRSKTCIKRLIKNQNSMFENPPKFAGRPEKKPFGRRKKPSMEKPKLEEGAGLVQLKRDRDALQTWMGEPGVATSDDRKQLKFLNGRIAELESELQIEQDSRELEDLKQQRDTLEATGEGKVSIGLLNKRITGLETSLASSPDSNENKDNDGGEDERGGAA